MGNKGIVYFEDGHSEPVLFYYQHSRDLIEFYTQSGKYCYVTCVGILHNYSVINHRFYRSCMTVDEFGGIDTRWLDDTGIESFALL